MTDANHHTALPVATAPPRIHHTYVVGEDDSRLANAAHYFGLASARRPLGNVRQAVTAMFQDHTLESARMHSVGVLAEDERVDQSGTLHLMTLTHRKRRKDGVMSSNEPPTSYGNLQDLFHKGPIITASTIEDDDDEEEEVLQDTVEGGSLTAAVFGIIKGTVGPAILYLPRGFQLSGYAVAIPSMIIATLSYLYSARRLLQCWKAEKEKMARLEELRGLLEPASTTTKNYGSVEAARQEEDATTTLLTYPELARRAFGSGSAVVQLGVALMQFGVCLTYLIFVPQNLVESVKVLFGYQVDKLYFLIGMVFIEIPLSWIRDIRKLTPTNILATFLIAYGLVSCLAIALTVTFQDHNSTLIERLLELPATNDTWYLFIGTSFFVFEGSITLIVPLQEAVFHKEDKEKFPHVNQTVTSWIVVFYIFFAITCWASFGENVKTALTASLPEGAFATVVQFAYSIAVIFTFPLQAFPALEVVFHSSFSKKTMATTKGVLQRNIIAAFITCLLGVVAYLAIDYLGNVVSLLGSLVGIPIALIYPPLMHNRLVVKDDASKATTKWMNNCVAGLGFLAMGVASFTTIVSWDKGAEG